MFAQITPLYEQPNAFIDSVQNKGLIIPFLKLRLDSANQLYHKENLVFKPEGEYESCIYEIVNNRYLIITPISKDKYFSSAIYMLPKRKVKIYKLGDYRKSYEYEFIEKIFIGIKGKRVILEDVQGRVHFLKIR